MPSIGRPREIDATQWQAVNSDPILAGFATEAVRLAGVAAGAFEYAQFDGEAK